MTASPAATRALLASRAINHVVVIGANGTMGFGSAGLFTNAVPRVTFLARTKEKAAEGVAAAVKQVRSSSLASRTDIGDYEHDLDRVCGEADLIFEALSEDLAIKRPMFERIDAARAAGLDRRDRHVGHLHQYARRGPQRELPP